MSVEVMYFASMTDYERPAFKAEAEAGLRGRGQEAKAEGQEAKAALTLLAQNPKAAKILAEAEAARQKTQNAILKADADQIREAKIEEAAAEAKLAKANEKAQRKAEAKAAVQEGRRRAFAKAKAFVGHLQSEAAASYSAFVYVVVVGLAAFSQMKVFKDSFQWELLPSLGAAIFIEGIGLAFYSTSIRQRLDNRSGLVSRLFAWAFTFGAAYMQYVAHRGTELGGVPLLSYAMAGASIAALTLAEIRTNHKVAQRLEELDRKPRPRASLGALYCVRYPKQAFWAFSAMIAIPSIRTRSAGLRAGRLMRHMYERKAFNRFLMDEATRAARKAEAAGNFGAVTFHLHELAHYGLEGLRIQEKLASASEASLVEEAEATERPIKAEASLERPTEAEAERPIHRPTIRKAVAQRPAQPETVKAEAEGEAGLNGLDSEILDLDIVWAGRPGGLIAWTDRLAELASHYPHEAGDLAGVPSRATIVKDMAEKRAAGIELRHAWTNKMHVGWAMNDLRELRRVGKNDPAAQSTRSDN